MRGVKGEKKRRRRGEEEWSRVENSGWWVKGLLLL